MSASPVTRAILEARLAECRTAKQTRLHQHERLQAALAENANQINALIGRETELTELLALTDGDQ